MNRIIGNFRKKVKDVDKRFDVECDWLDGENLVLNVTGPFTNKFKSGDKYDRLNELHNDFGRRIEKWLNDNMDPPEGHIREDGEWTLHESEGFFWDKYGDETDGYGEFRTMQYQLYWSYHG